MSTDSERDSAVSETIVQVDALHAAGNAAEALSRVREALRDGNSVELLWRAARESVHLGILDQSQGREDAARRWFAAAEGWARRTVDHAPSDPRGWSWLAVTLGRRSELEGTMTRVKMANEVKHAADSALARDPDQSGALHVLATWHAEIMRLNAVERFTARRLLGGSTFDAADWVQAEALLRRAVQLSPEEIVHRIEYARILRDLDREEEARAQLRDAVGLAPIHPADPTFIEEARRLLSEWGG